jgi:D-glycero-D-manno-heptose 1,7-bisphosphate phosphatase
MREKYTTLFLDRDGVINHKIDGYVQFFSQFKFIEDVPESIARLSNYFIRIIIVTNQQGIGKKIMTENQLFDLHDKMLFEINKIGGKIEKIYYCLHLESANCNCRKPKSGMLLKAKEDFPDIDFSKSILIGDSDTDIIAAENVNIKSIQVSPTYTLSHWTKGFLLD